MKSRDRIHLKFGTKKRVVKKFCRGKQANEQKWPNSIKIVNAIFYIYRKDAGSSLL